jgi:hypothetical protein
MRGPIRTPILLPFGNRNTQAEPHRAVSCANKPGLLRLAPPCSPGLSRRACDDVHRQAFLASPAVPRQTFRARSRLASHACPGHAFPCLPFRSLLRPPSWPCLPSDAVPRSLLTSPLRACQPRRSTPRRATPASPVLALPPLALPAEPVLPRLVMPAAPCHTRPSHAPVTSPAMPRQRCPRGLARRALP